MTTRGDFRESLRNVLSDKSQWRDTLVNEWINDAIRDYSRHLPRLAASTIPMVAGTKNYDLSTYEALAIREVEYPISQTPRRLLTYLPRENYGFDGGQYYDLKNDLTVLYMGETPSAGEYLYIEYDKLHTIPSTDGVSLTVPDGHLEALRLFVVWKALTQLAMDENVSVDRDRADAGSLGLNAYRAERAYRSHVREMLANVARSEFTGPWRADKFDQVY